jgi:hypothetical protein
MTQREDSKAQHGLSKTKYLGRWAGEKPGVVVARCGILECWLSLSPLEGGKFCGSFLLDELILFYYSYHKYCSITIISGLYREKNLIYGTI